MKHACLRAIAAVLSLGALSAPALGQTVWDMPTPYGDAVFHTQNIIQFAEDVNAATDGALRITVHSANSLFGHPEIKDAVRRGLAPVGEVLMSRLANEDAVFGLDSVPFVASSYEEAEKLWAASRDDVTAKLAEQGLTLLFAVPWPGQSLFTRAPVDSVGDLRGVAFRAYNTATERLAQLAGAIPTQVEEADISTAFSTSRVAAMITSPSTGVSSQAWDFTTHFTDTQAWLPKNIVFANTRAFEALTEEEQAALIEAAAAAEARGWEMSQEETAKQIETLAENGMNVSTPSETLAAELQEIGATMRDEWVAAAGPAGGAVIDAYLAE